MPDRRYVATGLAVIFLVLAYPWWRAAVLGTRASAPTLAKARSAPCVLPRAEMRASHMTLLAEWRDRAVRDGVRRVTMPSGKTYRASLSGTCLDCHEKAKFCDSCHQYAGARPECWTCHVEPRKAGALRHTVPTSAARHTVTSLSGGGGS